MAIIDCPECGGKISTSTKQCVHCGCNILICPECNDAYNENIDTCKTCGYQFIKKNDSTTDNKKDNCIDSFDKWKSSSVFNEIITSNWIINLIITLSFVLLFIAFLKFQNWVQAVSSDNWKEALNAAALTSNVKGNITLLVVFSLILGSVAVVFGCFSGCFLRRSLIEWFSNKNIDLVSSIREYLLSSKFSLKTKQGLKKERVIMATLIDICMIKDTVHLEKARNKDILISVLFIALEVVLGVLLLTRVGTVMQEIILYGIEESSYLSAIDNPGRILIFMLIMYCFLGMFYFFMSRPRKKRNKFVKENITDAYGIYTNYFKI